MNLACRETGDEPSFLTIHECPIAYDNSVEKHGLKQSCDEI
jgi:hypothetical protein